MPPLPERARALALAASLVLAGCADQTAILVEVTSTDLAVPTDVDSIEIHAISGFGSMHDGTYSLSTGWPHTLTLLPAPQEGIGPVRIDVTARHGGTFVVRRVVATEFVPGMVRRFVITLSRSCLGVMCADGVDCNAGACSGGVADGGVGDAGTDAPSIDAPSDLDAPGLDAPGLDAPGIDAPGIDAPGIDAGAGTDAPLPFDAGRDAPLPIDAGTDAPPPPSDAGPAAARLVINEIDYDQNSTDTAEYVEIFNAGTAPAALAGIALVVVNGSSPASEYGRVMLTGTLAPGAFLVVSSATSTTLTVPGGVPRFDLVFESGSTSIQNGDPDGVILWNTTTGTAIDALAYGGAITSATIDAPGAATGVSLVEGTMTALRDSATAVRSLCRRPDGTDTNNASSDWMMCGTLTPGAPN